MAPHDDQLKAVFERLDAKHMLLQRSMAFGGAAAALAILLVLSQVGLKDGPLTFALIATTIALPCWVACASMHESLVFFGPASYVILRSGRLRVVMAMAQTVAALALTLSIGLLAWHLSVLAGIVFALVAGVMATAAVVVNECARRSAVKPPRE
jgi:hypothetical protein